MDRAKPFQSGRSQAARLPKHYRFQGSEVVVKHVGNGVLLLPIDAPWQILEAGLGAFEAGFLLSRKQPDEQARNPICPGSCSTPTSASRASMPNKQRC